MIFNGTPSMRGNLPWLRDLAQLLIDQGLQIQWSVPERELMVRAGDQEYPVLWVNSRGRVDVTPFAEDVDHPGFRVAQNLDGLEETVEVLQAVLSSGPSGSADREAG